MAEADVAVQPKIFFCHSCNREVTPVLPDYLCSRCKSGFIEEVEDDSNQSEDSEITDAAETFVDHWDDLYDLVGGGRRASRRRGQPMRGRGPQVVFRFGSRVENGSGNSSNQPGPSSITMLSPHGMGGPGQANYMDLFIQQLFSNLGVTFVRGGDGMNQMGLGGVMGDYALGPNGLDNIITQLLNQLDNTGPPPAEKSRIESLPLIQVNQKMVDDHAECAVCKDEYTLGEDVKCLPCDHLFHTVCVDPWLDMHDSCPICRCNLEGERPKVDNS